MSDDERSGRLRRVHSSFIIRPFVIWPAAAALIALAVALFTAAIYWNPVGARRDGRVMVVERHSDWEPTTKPYDTKWFAEPKLFGEASGYNYAAIYDYLGQYYQMSRLLESDKIDDETLGKCDVLVIKIPTTRYTKDEADAVVRFVEQGGGLLLIGDHTNFDGSATAMNDITRPMGFIFRDDLLFGFNDRPTTSTTRRPPLPHPILQHVPPLDFAVSCSIDPGHSRGRAVIAQHRPVEHGTRIPPRELPSLPAALPGNARRRVRPSVGGLVRAGPGRGLHRLDDLLELLHVSAGPGGTDAGHGRMAQPRQSAGGSPSLAVLLGLLPLAAGLWMALRLPSPFGRGAGGEGGSRACNALNQKQGPRTPSP